MTDHAGTIIYINAVQARIDDFDPHTVIGCSVKDVYRVDNGVSPTMTCLETGRSVDNLARHYRTRLGKVVNSIQNVFPLYDGRRLLGASCGRI